MAVRYEWRSWEGFSNDGHRPATWYCLVGDGEIILDHLEREEMEGVNALISDVRGGANFVPQVVWEHENHDQMRKAIAHISAR